MNANEFSLNNNYNSLVNAQRFYAWISVIIIIHRSQSCHMSCYSNDLRSDICENDSVIVWPHEMISFS